MADDKPILWKEVALNGQLRTDDDPAIIGTDFRELKNMRSRGAAPRGIKGMTKINTVALPSAPLVKSIAQMQKGFPPEAHILAHAKDASGLNGGIYQNSTAVPGAGNFEVSPLFMESVGAGSGHFCPAPRGKMLFTNGVDTAIWPGSEMDADVFIDYDLNGTYKYDYTAQVGNTLTDAANLATVHRVAVTLDADTKSLLHFNNNVTDFDGNTPDATVTPKVYTVVGTGAYTTTSAFGTHAFAFNGSTYLTTPDGADFDLSSGGTFECRVRLGAGNGIPSGTYFSQWTDADNYIRLYRSGNNLILDLKNATNQVTLTALAQWMAFPVSPNYSHVALAINKIDTTYYYYIFLDGYLIGSKSSTTGPPNSTGVVHIGAYNTGSATDIITAGYADEMRFSSVARWTSSFSRPAQAYGSGSFLTTFHIASPLPLNGVKFYVETANTTAGAITAGCWTGSEYGSVVVSSDGTSVGGIPLAQDGTVSFASTVATAKQKAVDGVVRYWYQLQITNCDATTTISRITLSAPMQQLVELWDGEARQIGSFQVYKSGTFNDNTVNVFEASYDTNIASTYADISSLTTGTECLYGGFTERQMGLSWETIGGAINTTAGTVASVYYYNGGDPALDSGWSLVGSVDDGTSNNGISLAKSGVMTWNPPDVALEFKTKLAGNALSAVNKPALYYYKVKFSASLSGSVKVFFVGGIPAPVAVGGYAYALNHLNSVWLVGKASVEPNAVLVTQPNTSQVLSGNSVMKLYFGETPLVAGASLYGRLGSNAYNMAVFMSKSETHVAITDSNGATQQYRVSESVGCTAPLTVAVVPIGIDAATGLNRHVVIWQSDSGIVAFDGTSIIPLSLQIRDKFDPSHANYVGAATLATCTGFIDQVYGEYHWIIPGVTEWVYSFVERKWHEFPRSASTHLNCGCSVMDANGKFYSYGAGDSGIVWRLENGFTFDGAAVDSSMWFGDIAPAEGNVHLETDLRWINLVTNAGATGDTLTLTTYADGSTAPIKTHTFSTVNAGKRIKNISKSDDFAPGSVFHSVKITHSSSTASWEPKFLALGYRVNRSHTKDC